MPDWLKGCEREGRIVGVRAYYLDAVPKRREIGPSPQVLAARTLSAKDSPRIEHTPPTPERDSTDRNGFGVPAAEPPMSPPLPGDARISDGASTSAGGKEVDVEDEDEDEESDDTEKGEEDDDEDDMEEKRQKSRMPLEQEQGRDVVAEHEASSEDGRFDEVAL